MVANSSPSPSAAHPVILTGAEKVAVLLLALGKQRAAKL
jgi:flagellar motor switch protein FliG